MMVTWFRKEREGNKYMNLRHTLKLEVAGYGNELDVKDIR